MTLLEKLLGLFGRDTNSNSIKDYQSQSKPNITTASVNPLYSAPLSPTSTGKFDVAVVGVYFHQEILQQICGNKHEGGVPIYKQAMLVPEDDNPEDANAVRVDIEGETVGHLSRRNATLWRSKMISENRSGVVMRPAEIVWDRGYVAEGSYGVLLDIDLSLPDSKIELGSVGRVWESPGQSDHIEFLVDQLNRVELSLCKVGDPVNLWDATGNREIFIYRQGTDFGEGKIGICPEEVYRTIRKAPGCDASIASIYDGGCKISCKLLSKAEMAERLKPLIEQEEKKLCRHQRDLTLPVEYSTIDSDIYSCFISGKNDLYGGTSVQIKRIEERIAIICQENKGRYYKTQAKGAKFSIVLSPTARLYTNVMSLKEKGYKVTNFEKALEHFGLTDFWDCKELIKAVKNYKKELKKHVKTLQKYLQDLEDDGSVKLVKRKFVIDKELIQFRIGKYDCRIPYANRYRGISSEEPIPIEVLIEIPHEERCFSLRDKPFETFLYKNNLYKINSRDGYTENEMKALIKNNYYLYNEKYKSI